MKNHTTEALNSLIETRQEGSFHSTQFLNPPTGNAKERLVEGFAYACSGLTHAGSEASGLRLSQPIFETDVPQGEEKQQGKDAFTKSYTEAGS